MALQTFKEEYLTQLYRLAQSLNILGEDQAVIINQHNLQAPLKWIVLRSQYAIPPIEAHVPTPKDSNRYLQTCLTILWLVVENICQISRLTMMEGPNPLLEPMLLLCLQANNRPVNFLPLFTVKLNHLRKRITS